MQKTVKIPHVQGEVFDDPEIMQRQVPTVLRLSVCKLYRNLSSFHSCTVVDVPVLTQRRPGGASDEFIDKLGTILRRGWGCRKFTAFFALRPFGRRVRTFWAALSCWWSRARE